MSARGCGIGITPYAAGQFTTFDLPAYAEQAVVGANTFALAYGSKSVTASRSELGLRSDKSFAMQDGIFTLRGRAAWAHDFNTDRVIGATFQTLPGASFVVNGAAQAHDAALVTASAEMKWLNGWSAAATFEGEFSNVTTQLRRQGRGAIFLVVATSGFWHLAMSDLSPLCAPERTSDRPCPLIRIDYFEA